MTTMARRITLNRQHGSTATEPSATRDVQNSQGGARDRSPSNPSMVALAENNRNRESSKPEEYLSNEVKYIRTFGY